MRVCFLTNGPIQWASARYRAFWIAECRDDWAAYELEKLREIPDADVYVFAKTFSIELVRQLRANDRRVYWDLCDPLHWFSPNESREMLELVDGVVCSNQGLADDVRKWSDDTVPTYVIPDRLKLSHYDKQRKHHETNPVRFIWYGSAQNRAVLYPAYVTLQRLKALGYEVELTIMDDRPDISLSYGPTCPVYFARWSLEREVETIANHDIALLPPYPGEWSKVKSNNKMLTAWACGLPALTGDRWHDGLLSLVESPVVRTIQARTGRKQVEEHYTVDKSAADWEAILCAS